MSVKEQPILAAAASILLIIVCVASLCYVWQYSGRVMKILIVAALCFMAFGSVMAGVAFWRDFHAT